MFEYLLRAILRALVWKGVNAALRPRRKSKAKRPEWE